jgi:methylmalonyl-CoA/ethylmalonyl-CoA epimerase
MNLKFHHLGVACSRIESGLEYYESLGYVKETETFVDYQIGIKCLFIVMQDSPRLELCEALPGNNVLTPWLAGGSPIYHLAFKVDIKWDKFKKGPGEKIVFPPTPAIAFHGKKVWFTLRANRQLVEYIEND